MPGRSDRLIQREVLEVTNEDTAPLVLVLEPWAESYLVPPRTAVEIVAFAPDEGRLVVESAGHGLVVWGWTGSSVHVIQNDQELEPATISSVESARIAARRTLPPIIQHRVVWAGP